MRRGLCLLSSLLLLAACQSQPEQRAQQQQQRVDAAEYDQFWLWAGVKPQPVLDHAKEVYILDSEYRGGDRLVPLRPAIPRAGSVPVWLVVRVETLDWSAGIPAQLAARIGRWRAAGNNLRGVQIDFDAATRGLDGYAAFLRDLRRRLPADLKLSITGLMDWSANGDPGALSALSGVIDEVVIQTYQGRSTIPGYEAYLARLSRLDLPYKIGLVQHGEWREPAGLRDDPDFRGHVVFLVNPPE